MADTKDVLGVILADLANKVHRNRDSITSMQKIIQTNILFIQSLDVSLQFLLKKNAEVGTYTSEEDAEAGGGEDGSVEDEVIV